MSSVARAAHARADRARQVAYVLWIVLGLNWAVALIKILLGLATSSLTIVADGLHSFSDGASNIVGLAAIRIAGHPADDDHPYGHQKFETLASTAIAIILFFVAYGIYKKAITGWSENATPDITPLSFVVMGITLVINIFVVWFERSKAGVLKSDLLKVDSWHTLTDVFVTLSVLAALVGIRLGISHLDSIAALIVATVILFTAIGIIKQSTDVLVDKAVLNAETVKKIVMQIPAVLDCHEIRSRGRVDDIYLDLHVLVDNDMTVLASHELAHLIEKKLRQEIPGVEDVVVHIEPISHGHEMEGAT
jgi:cation diffusion facilitator family transporter